MGVEEEKKSYYGKRPLWQWIVLYLIIGAIVYAAVYYIFLANKGGYNAPGNTTQNNSPYNYNK